MSETLDYLRTFAQFPFSLRRFLSHKWTLEAARRVVQDRMEHREDNFLLMAERSIFAHPPSPYLALLKLAGCELGDLRDLVRRAGLDNALRHLRQEGVYVTFEEFKGRRPIVRHGATIAVTPRDFDNPFMRRDFALETGGSTGAAMNVGVDLEHITARGPHEMLGLAAYGLLDAPVVTWQGTLPTGSMRNLLRAVSFGQVPTQWFTPFGLRDSKEWVKYGLATYYILLWLRIYGVAMPWPRHVGVERAEVVARCIADLMRKYGQCMLHTSVSRALRVCLAAQAAGLDLRGAVFQGTAEPPTVAKVSQIEAAGIRFISHYAMVEANRIGSGCAKPADVSDVHLLKDAFALFTYPYEVEGLGIAVESFNLTTLLSAAPKLMLNVQMDDYGIVEERNCGCPLESYGYTTHLRQIRSYSKLTGEGVTLIGTEVARLVEEVLPQRFGGSPLDYQLLEQEDEQGFTRVYLVISPRVTIADEGQVVDVFMAALAKSSGMADAARMLWQHTQTIRVKRMEPVLTSRGKLQPLSVQRGLGRTEPRP